MAKYIEVICRVNGETVLRLNNDFNCSENNVFYYNHSRDQIQDIGGNDCDFDLSRVKQEVLEPLEETQDSDLSEEDFSLDFNDFFGDNHSFIDENECKSVSNEEIIENHILNPFKDYVLVTKTSGHKLFNCQYHSCEYKTQWKTAITNHIHNHLNYKPFVCDVSGCDKRFAINSNLTNHKKRHLKTDLKDELKTNNTSEENEFNINGKQVLSPKKTKSLKTKSYLNQNMSKTSFNQMKDSINRSVKNTFQTIKSQQKVLLNKNKIKVDQKFGLDSSETSSSHSNSQFPRPIPKSFDKPNANRFVGIKSVEKYFTKSLKGGKLWRSCLICKSYGTCYATSMVYHIRLHLNDCPFMCCHCGKAFAIKTNLNNHLVVHKSK